MAIEVKISLFEDLINLLKEIEHWNKTKKLKKLRKSYARIFVLMNECKNVDLSDDDKIAIKSFLDDVSQILGVDFNLEEASAGSDDLFNLITDVRSELRAAKQYELSDKIRDELINLGYEIND